MQERLKAILSIATDLTTSINSKHRYEKLLCTVKSIVGSDAAALLKKEGDYLNLLASDGMNCGVILAKYKIREHPRLQIVCQSKMPIIFPADSSLPDPFDCCLTKNHEGHIRIHSCLGCPLIVENELIGVLTADSLKPGVFDHLDLQFLSTLSALAGATLRTSNLIEALEKTAAKRKLITKDLMQSVNESAGSFLLGTTPIMQKLREEIDFAAQCDLTVLIHGETGSGKELVARSIQARSRRKNDAMIYVNCAALPENIIESELFGHTRGAFTGANSNRAGKFEVADGGTIFLDEIGEIPLSIQAKLLRVLQEGEIQRVGSDQTLKVDTRVITATNRNLTEEVRTGRFRSDLFYRLNVYPIHVPPLREHKDDIPYLASYFCDLNQRKLNVKSIHLLPKTMEILSKYPWPGNVRELKNIIDQTILKAKFKKQESEHLEIHHSDLPTDLRGDSETNTNFISISNETTNKNLSLREAIDEFQKELILTEIKHQKGNWAKAANRLGLHRSNLFTLAKRLRLK